MNIVDHALAFINWLFGFVGILALMAGIAFLPSLFGREVADQSLIEVFEIVLSKNVLTFFSGNLGIGIIICATALFTWICLILSMSTHAMIVSFVDDITQGIGDAERFAWGFVLFINLILVTLFVVILFGGIFQAATFLIWSLLMVAVMVLLLANYSDSNRS